MTVLPNMSQGLTRVNSFPTCYMDHNLISKYSNICQVLDILLLGTKICISYDAGFKDYNKDPNITVAYAWWRFSFLSHNSKGSPGLLWQPDKAGDRSYLAGLPYSTQNLYLWVQSNYSSFYHHAFLSDNGKRRKAVDMPIPFKVMIQTGTHCFYFYLIDGHLVT